MLESIMALPLLFNSARAIVFLLVTAALLGWNYVQYQQKEGLRLHLRAVEAELALCQGAAETGARGQESASKYQSEQGDISRRYYEGMPKKPDIQIEPDIDNEPEPASGGISVREKGPARDR